VWNVGAINSRPQLDRIVDLAAAGDAEGVKRWTSSCPLPERSLFFPPTVFSGVEQTMRVAREEIFGPVLSVLTFRTPDEAVAKANNTPYRLSAGIWTEKGSKALWTAQRVRAGVVWTNTFNRFDPTTPFGGVSGVRVRARGRAGRAGGVPAGVTPWVVSVRRELAGPHAGQERLPGRRAVHVRRAVPGLRVAHGDVTGGEEGDLDALVALVAVAEAARAPPDTAEVHGTPRSVRYVSAATRRISATESLGSRASDRSRSTFSVATATSSSLLRCTAPMACST